MPWNTTLKVRTGRQTRPRIPTLRVLFTVDRPVLQAVRVLTSGPTAIGRAVEEGVQLAEDPRVSRRHATVTVSPDGTRVRLEDTSSTGTEVDGQRVAAVDLADGAVLRMGDTFLLFRFELADVQDAPVEGLLGEAPVMRNLRSTLKLVGETSATVLLLGESGTGKEVAARALHDLSQRTGSFVPVNCSAIPESLAEAQLFGHTAGAFTGAKTEQPGFFRAAEGGTLFLDEIGDLPATVQPKLLRALEERVVTPVGSTQTIPCDLRLVAATNRDVVGDVLSGGFRGDLYARIGEFTIELPPLRERREDVLPILLGRLALGDLRMAPELAEALLLHPWPFNVRELVKVAVQLQVRGSLSDRLELDMVEDYLQRSASVRPVPSEPAAPRSADSTAEPFAPSHSSTPPPGATIPDRRELEALLRRYNGVIADVARETKRSRKQVYRWLEQYDLDPKDYREVETG